MSIFSEWMAALEGISVKMEGSPCFGEEGFVLPVPLAARCDSPPSPVVKPNASQPHAALIVGKSTDRFSAC